MLKKWERWHNEVTKDMDKSDMQKWSDEIDAKLELEDEQIPEDKIIREQEPIPELNLDKFAMERGNDEVAMWIKSGRESGHLNETMIGISLVRYLCPLSYHPGQFCSWESHNRSFKELFNHFKIHYKKDEVEIEARELYRRYKVNQISAKDVEKKTTYYYICLKEADNPTKWELKPWIESIEKDRDKWINIAYAMLQECFVYEVNMLQETEHGRKIIQSKHRKRAIVIYKMQKVYGLTTQHIARIFRLNLTEVRKMAYDGLKAEYRKVEDLPKWMQGFYQTKEVE